MVESRITASGGPPSKAERPRLLARAAAALVSRPHRSVALPVSAIALGLIVAGAGVFRKAPQPITQAPPGYVALVNQQGILMSDFISQTDAETAQPFDETTRAERARVLHEMIDQELLVQRALALDLPETATEVRTTMADAVNAQVAAPLLAEQPTQAELYAFYLRHRADYTSEGTMTVHDLVLHVGGYQNADQTVAQAEADAVEAVYQLRSGASIEYVEEHFGFVNSARVSGGRELDFAAKIHLGKQLYQVAATLAGGEVSDPVVRPDGVHVLIMEARQPPAPADFPSARARVYDDFVRAEINRAKEANLQFLRSRAEILLAPGESE